MVSDGTQGCRDDSIPGIFNSYGIGIRLQHLPEKLDKQMLLRCNDDPVGVADDAAKLAKIRRNFLSQTWLPLGFPIKQQVSSLRLKQLVE
ncbi:hypothetical protein D3C73_1346680 [compost metagenome]